MNPVLQSGSLIFIDANIFLFSIFDDPDYGADCTKFISAIEHGVSRGIISVSVLDEILFKMLITETSERFDIPIKKSSRFLKQNPDKIPLLDSSWRNIERIQNLKNLIVLDVQLNVFKDSIDIGREYGLLPHDALIVSFMNKYNLTNLASNDSDFERVNWIKLYKPLKK